MPARRFRNSADRRTTALGCKEKLTGRDGSPTRLARKGASVRRRVLLTDDDADVCALLTHLLEPVAEVVSVGDAEAALALLGSGAAFDAVISDFMLPGLDGIEFVARVRRDAARTRLPILMFSGHGAREISARARAAGADAFLDKPFAIAELRAAVTALLTRDAPRA